MEGVDTQSSLPQECKPSKERLDALKQKCEGRGALPCLQNQAEMEAAVELLEKYNYSVNPSVDVEVRVIEKKTLYGTSNHIESQISTKYLSVEVFYEEGDCDDFSSEISISDFNDSQKKEDFLLLA